MNRNLVLGLLMLSGISLIAPPALAAEPSLHQVYQAAEAGRLNEAQNMMQEVLQAHPNSGKAHYVEAELLVKQGQLGKAESELNAAERLAPGLPFAQPQAVQNLKNLLGKGQATRESQPLHALPTAERAATPGFPWSLLLVGAALIAFIFWAVGFMRQRNATATNGNYIPRDNHFGTGNPAMPHDMPPPVYAPGSPGTAAAPAQGPGIGSRIMGGLASGAAVGAGVVAGEALMHHFMDGDKEKKGNNGLFDLGPADGDSYADDLGGNDFGIADGGSWDDGPDSGSDWN